MQHSTKRKISTAFQRNAVATGRPLRFGRREFGWIAGLRIGIASFRSIARRRYKTHLGIANLGAPILRVALLSLLLLCSLLLGPSAASDAVVVRPEGWSTALQAWKQYRSAQGYEIAEIDSGIGCEQIRQAIIELARRSQGKLKFVILAGDVTDANMAPCLPTFYHSSSAMVQFGGDPVICSDNAYGDLDGDHVPDLAVGRIPADSSAQLSQFLDRCISHEQQGDYSNWRRRVHVIAGVGGFGHVADSVIEMTTRQFLSERVPGWAEMTMTQASLQSPYCPDPFQFSETCIGRMNEGGMFWVYIGHGNVNGLDYMRAGDALLPIFSQRQISKVDTRARAPIAVFLSCYTGAFDTREDSFAEQLVMSPTGPIAAIAASRVSGPYGLAMLSDGLLESCFNQQTKTVGEIMLGAKRALFDDARFEISKANPGDGTQIEMINAIAGAMSPDGYDLKAERIEHVWQVNLLGDPMLHLSYPIQIDFQAPSEIAPGQSLVIDGVAAIEGKLTVEVTRRRGRIAVGSQDQVVGIANATERAGYQQRYQHANDSSISAQSADVSTGAFSIAIPIPADLERGKYCLRLYLEGSAGWQVGHSEVRVVRPKSY